MTTMSTEDRAAQLLRMAAALEESIIRLEAHGRGEARESVRRLRALQSEILTALYQLEADFRPDA